MMTSGKEGVSERKRDSNRRNARHSTGPRSPQGKAAVRRNALRHGLAVATGASPKVMDSAIEALAHALYHDAVAGTGPDGSPDPESVPDLLAAAQDAALAQHDLARIQAITINSFSVHGVNPDGPPHQDVAAVVEDLLRLERYRRRATSRRNRFLKILQESI